MVNFGPGHQRWNRFVSLGHPSRFQRVSPSWLRYCSDFAHRRPSKLCTMFGYLLGWYTIYIFWGLLPHNGILPGAKFTLRLSLALSYIGSVTARHSSSGRQPNFAALSGGRQLYSAGRPSRWALAHILVSYISLMLRNKTDIEAKIKASAFIWSKFVLIKYSSNLKPRRFWAFV